MKAFKNWLIERLGGVPLEHHNKIIHVRDAHSNKLIKDIARHEKIYQDQTERIRLHILRETFGNQQFSLRRDDFEAYMLRQVSQATKEYFNGAQPDLGGSEAEAINKTYVKNK